jgi:hypothetical protein
LFTAEIDTGPASRRRKTRRKAATAAVFRRQQGQPEKITLFDLSPEGCGFDGIWPIQPGAQVWLRLPGLESWAAIVTWYDNGRGGLRFERPLHPAVAERFFSQG